MGGIDPAPPENVNVWSRQLSNGSVALVFVNAEEEAGERSIRCDWADCLNATGLPRTARLRVQDLAGLQAPFSTTASEGIVATAKGQGGSAMFLLTPVQDVRVS